MDELQRALEKTREDIEVFAEHVSQLQADMDLAKRLLEELKMKRMAEETERLLAECRAYKEREGKEGTEDGNPEYYKQRV